MIILFDNMYNKSKCVDFFNKEKGRKKLLELFFKVNIINQRIIVVISVLLINIESKFEFFLGTFHCGYIYIYDIE